MTVPPVAFEKPAQRTRKMCQWRTIAANCEDQKTEDVNVSEAEKGSAEDAVCRYNTLLLQLERALFLEDSFSKTAKLQSVHTRTQSYGCQSGPRTKVSFLAQK